MQMRIRHKLFLVLLAASVLVALVGLGLTRWSFNRGFVDYLNALESQRLDALASTLIEVYRAEGSWEPLTRDPRRWRAIMDEYVGRIRGFEKGQGPGLRPPPPPPRPLGAGEPVRRPQLPGPMGFQQPVDLLDAEGETVIGKPGDRANARLRPVQLDGQSIGFLRYLPITTLTELDEDADRQFAAQQRQGLLGIAALVLLIAVAFALWLARQLEAPIGRLTRGASAMASGRFSERIPVTSGDELGKLAANFNAMASTLEQNRVMRQQWLVDISHELRTPLAILAGELQAIEDGVRTWDDVRRKSLQAEVGRLTRLVDDLNDLSLSESGSLILERKSVDFVTVVGDALESCDGRLRESRLRVTTEFPDEAYVRGDARRLEQLVVNLLENSARYTNPGGVLRLRCERNDHVILVVEDSEPGVPEEALPRLFDRLYRVESSRSRAHGGSGLGLAICKSIVEGHGGTMASASSPLGGLAIEILLPHERS